MEYAVERMPYDYRSDPAVPRFADDRPIINIDGKCVAVKTIRGGSPSRLWTRRAKLHDGTYTNPSKMIFCK
jgi:hypothetical protein